MNFKQSVEKALTEKWDVKSGKYTIRLEENGTMLRVTAPERKWSEGRWADNEAVVIKVNLATEQVIDYGRYQNQIQDVLKVLYQKKIFKQMWLIDGSYTPFLYKWFQLKLDKPLISPVCDTPIETLMIKQRLPRTYHVWDVLQIFASYFPQVNHCYRRYYEFTVGKDGYRELLLMLCKFYGLHYLEKEKSVMISDDAIEEEEVKTTPTNFFD